MIFVQKIQHVHSIQSYRIVELCVCVCVCFGVSLQTVVSITHTLPSNPVRHVHSSSPEVSQHPAHIPAALRIHTRTHACTHTHMHAHTHTHMHTYTYTHTHTHTHKPREEYKHHLVLYAGKCFAKWQKPKVGDKMFVISAL